MVPVLSLQETAWYQDPLGKAWSWVCEEQSGTRVCGERPGTWDIGAGLEVGCPGKGLNPEQPW